MQHLSIKSPSLVVVQELAPAPLPRAAKGSNVGPMVSAVAPPIHCQLWLKGAFDRQWCPLVAASLQSDPCSVVVRSLGCTDYLSLLYGLVCWCFVDSSSRVSTTATCLHPLPFPSLWARSSDCCRAQSSAGNRLPKHGRFAA